MKGVSFVSRRGAALGFAAAAVLAAGPALAAPPAAQLKQEGYALIDGGADRMGRLGDAIFSYSEIGFQETKTIALVAKELKAAGFDVQTGVAGMPTAYMARYGSGAPVIGLMSDFDGIPGASQKPTALVHDLIVAGAPGHGEGHSTHQPTLIAAAMGHAELGLAAFHITRAATGDAVYAQGRPVAGFAGGGRDTANLIQLRTRVRPTRHLEAYLSLTHAWVGRTVRAAGGRDATYARAQFTAFF